jgi:SAM-dependent methyltransferase
VPLLQAGLDVDGVDISVDMLARARDLARLRGLPEPTLVAQPMHQLSLPRRYRTIIICGAFGLGGTRAQDREALRRIRDHLLPGGALVFDHYLPYDDVSVEAWSRWLPGHRGTYPHPWPEEGERRPLPDGDELELHTRALDFDPLLQRRVAEMRLRQWRGDVLVAEETRTLRESFYFAQEVLEVLAGAGFGDVRVEGRYSGRPATRDDSILTFVARVGD